MKNILIYPNTSKENIVDVVLLVVREILKNGNVNICIPDFYKENVPNTTKISMNDGFIDCDLIITLGGDGTMLNVIGKSAYYNIPIIGVNLGHMGFLTELDISELFYIKNILNGDYTIDKRMILDIKILRDGKVIFENISLNDVIIKTENSFRIMELEIFSDNTKVLSFGGDGVIIATPTGSTAYSMSAGGPVIEPEAHNICVTPICTHKFAGKSFVFSKDRVLHIKTIERNKNLAYIAVDGNSTVTLESRDVVEIKKAEQQVQFLRVKGQKFYQVLKEKIGGSFKNEI